MRSRYSAFVQGNIDYVEATHAADAEVGEAFDRAAAENMANSVEWIGLDIYETIDGAEGDSTGVVEFAAHYKQGDARQSHHERSTFRRDDGRWYYVDGDIDPKGKPVKVTKIGRNDPCHCGSGKKYKKCCGQ